MKSLYHKYCSIFLFLLFQWANAQFELKDSILLPFSSISHLQKNGKNEVVFIANNNTLITINEDHKITNKPLKKIVSHLDTNLSLRTSIVYNYQELEILDDKLNPIQDHINLNQYNIYPSAITVTDSQFLWYFDPIEQRLYQWNYQLKSIINKSNILHFKDDDTVIEKIHIVKNRIFLKGKNWIYEFDYFGNIKSQFNLGEHTNYCFSKENLHLLTEKNIKSINLLNSSISSTDNFFNVKDFIMDEDQLFVIKDKVMYIYTRIKN